MNKNSIIGILVIVGIGFIAFHATRPNVGDVGDSEFIETGTGDSVLDLRFKDYQGKTVALSEFAGKPLVINAWAAWCPFCKKELPDFAVAQKEFGDQVIIIAIDRKESLAIAKKYSDEVGVTNDLILLLDSDDLFYRAIGGFSMPETIFVNAAGEIVIHKRGPMELPEIREKIKSIL